MSEDEQQTHATEITILNRWLIGLVAFILIWTFGIMVYIEKKADDFSTRPAIVMVDSQGKINDAAYTNLFPKLMVSPTPFINTNKANKTNNNTIKIAEPFFINKKSYEVGEFVIINYFYVEGIVVGKHSDEYTVMYKSHNNTLETITLPREFLMSPSSSTTISPFSLMVD